MSNESNKLIKCGDHQFAPWVIVCNHVMNGTADEAIPLLRSDNSDQMFDWVCSDCADMIEDGNKEYLERLSCVCIHCLRDHVLPQYEEAEKDDDDDEEESIRYRITK